MRQCSISYYLENPPCSRVEIEYCNSAGLGDLTGIQAGGRKALADHYIQTKHSFAFLLCFIPWLPTGACGMWYGRGRRTWRRLGGRDDQAVRFGAGGIVYLSADQLQSMHHNYSG